MITIQTGDFTGLLSDVTPFAFPKDDMPSINVVRLEWDGHMLHASSTDTLRAARSSWHPDDDERGKNDKEPLIPAYGGGEDRWVIFMRLDDAKKLVDHFTLPKKFGGVPITLDDFGDKVRVSRSADTGHQAVTVTVETHYVEFPDLTKLLDADPEPVAMSQVAVVGRHLADFGSVRQRGVMTLTLFGPERAIRITIGDRFVATMRPDRSGERHGVQVEF